MPLTPIKNLPYPTKDDLAGKGNEHIRDLALGVDALPSPAPAWGTGDTKISAKTTTHADPQGGTWYLADGGAIPGGETALIAMLGSNLPDARGRGLVMLGTHADVNALARNDGVALAGRSPKHKATFVNPTVNSHQHGGGNHQHTILAGNLGPSGMVYQGSNAQTNEVTSYSGNIIAPEAPGTSGGTVGPQASSMVDTGSYQVVGNLFYHS